MLRPRPISLASGVLPEATPVQLVEAAAQGGFDFGGMWIEPARWSDTTTREVARRLADTGVRLLDAEVVWLKPGPPDPQHLRIIDIAAELGARNVLCVSSDPDLRATCDKLGLLCERGAAHRMRINLEFALFTEVKNIAQARALLAALDSPAAALLIDSLHWYRSGGTLAEVSSIPVELLSYTQLCDAPLAGANAADPEEILLEAIDGRVPLGAGGLPLAALLDHLPADLPIAVEERSKPLRDAYPDLNERARAVARTSRAYLAQYGSR